MSIETTTFYTNYSKRKDVVLIENFAKSWIKDRFSKDGSSFSALML